MIFALVVQDHPEGGYEALWLGEHQSSGTKGRGEDPIAALAALIVELDRGEAARAVTRSIDEGDDESR